MKVNRKLKAVLQGLIAKMPFSGKLNYFLQRHVRHSLPVNDAKLEQKIGFAEQHLKAFKSHGIVPSATTYEFGGGYDLTVPLYFNKIEFAQHTVTDVSPLLKWDLVNNIIKRLGFNGSVKSTQDLKQFNIDYKVPVNPKKTGFVDAKFDFIHSTVTLEHIPKNDILPILQECYRVLKAGGIISCIIDLQDHYHYADDSISPFDFYQYSWQEWDKKYNNKLQYQNRLLASEYYTMFAQAGFAPIQMQVTKASDAQIDELKNLNLHPDFATKPIDELSNLFCHIWAEKPD